MPRLHEFAHEKRLNLGHEAGAHFPRTRSALEPGHGLLDEFPRLLKLFVGQHIVNGLSVAGAVLTVSVGAALILGFPAGQPATLGAISGSISDFPAPWLMKTRTMLTGFALALLSTSAIQLVDRSAIAPSWRLA